MSPTVGQALTPQAEVVDLARTQLGASDWSQAQRHGAARAAAALIDDLPRNEFCIAGLAGAPGSGKSSLAQLVSGVLECLDRSALAISLDDYYLDRKQRQDRARLHPLFAQRGVPGSHDWTRLIDDLDRIREGRIEGIRLPRFDKSSDDRSAESESRNLEIRPQVVILEGWLIGAPPQDPCALRVPVNAMETKQDTDGRWRGLVNDALARYHEDLAPRLDRRWFLATPGWESVVNWRWQQEKQRPAPDRHLESRQAVVAFLDQFQRIAMHMLDTSREWADVIIRLDQHHVMHVD